MGYIGNTFANRYTLFCRGDGWPVNNTQTKTALVTVSIPPLGPNDKLAIDTLWSFTNSANNKALSIEYGGTTFMTANATTTATGHLLTLIQNNNNRASQNAYAASSSYGLATNSINGGSVDSTISQNLIIYGTMAALAETITLRGVLVELCFGT